jgi:hypothetical protein
MQKPKTSWTAFVCLLGINVPSTQFKDGDAAFPDVLETIKGTNSQRRIAARM